MANDCGSRILVLDPAGRGAETCAVLAQARIEARSCANMAELCAEIGRGAGAVFLSEEDCRGDLTPLLDALAGEEPGTELPLIVLTNGRRSEREHALDALDGRPAVSFFEHPVSQRTLVSAARTALEARQRQYQIHSLLERARAEGQQRDEFLAILSHELRNPLGAMRNAFELLRLEQKTPEDTVFAVDLMQGQIEHLVRLVNDLLEISRITRGTVELRHETLDLRAVIRAALDMSRAVLAERRHRVEVELPDEAVWVSGDEVRLKQVLGNLLDNAARYTEPGGAVRVSLRSVDGAAEVRVLDNGAGLSATMIERVFRLFARGSRANAGLGVGLTLSRSLAELHGGALTARSEGEGRGSEFTLRLPLAAEVVSRQGAEGEPHAPNGKGRTLRVLVVEDHADQARALALVLGYMGHETRIENAGVPALETARAWRPHVVLLDLGLPDLDGCDVARELRSSLGGDFRIAAVTGFGNAGDRARTLAAGFDAHFTKPLTQQQLRELLATAPID
jgi:signal transduction histidine kinase